MAHFAATELTIRQLLDWAFFVKKHTKEVDWKWLISVIDEVGALDLFNVFNAICVGLIPEFSQQFFFYIV